MQRPILYAAAPACLLLGLTPLSAAADVAPPGTANATAARVSDVAGVSNSRASASEENANARAAVLSLGDKPVLDTGGTQSNEGESGGALIDTGPGQPVRAQVAPWKASAKGAKGSPHRASQASTAAAKVDVDHNPHKANVGLLTSDAAAEHSNAKSTGKSTSNAADVSVDDTTRLVLLHSEVNDSAKGHSYLVGLNGTEIGTDEQFGKSCAFGVDGAVKLTCLTVSGGMADGVTTGEAEVLGVKMGLNPVSAFATSGTTAPGTPSILESVAAAVPAAEAPRAAAAPAPAPAPTASSTELPRTGVAAASLAASGLAGLLMGLALRLFARWRRFLYA